MLAKLLPALEIETVSILDGSPAIDRTLAELDLRARTGTTVLAVQRQRHMTTMPPSDYKLHVSDVLVLAQKTGVDLIVLTTHGRGRLSRY